MQKYEEKRNGMTKIWLINVKLREEGDRVKLGGIKNTCKKHVLKYVCNYLIFFLFIFRARLNYQDLYTPSFTHSESWKVVFTFQLQKYLNATRKTDDFCTVLEKNT